MRKQQDPQGARTATSAEYSLPIGQENIALIRTPVMRQTRSPDLVVPGRTDSVPCREVTKGHSNAHTGIAG